MDGISTDCSSGSLFHLQPQSLHLLVNCIIYPFFTNAVVVLKPEVRNFSLNFSLLDSIIPRNQPKFISSPNYLPQKILKVTEFANIPLNSSVFKAAAIVTIIINEILLSCQIVLFLVTIFHSDLILAECVGSSEKWKVKEHCHCYELDLSNANQHRKERETGGDVRWELASQ